MDNNSSRLAASLGLFALLLCLGKGLPTVADEVFVTDTTEADSQPADVVFITDDADVAPPAMPTMAMPSAAGSLVVVNSTVERTEQLDRQPVPAAATAPAVASAHGELRVVSNQAPQAALRPLPTQDVEPALLEQPAMISAPVANAAPIAAPAETIAPSEIQFATHQESIASKSAARPRSADEHLILGHQLAAEAEDIVGFAQIIEHCRLALRQGVAGDKQIFAKQLLSWALNRRGQLHSDLGEYELADSDFQAAIDFNPRNWRALHNRGVSFAQAGQFAEAFDDFNAVTQICPQYAKAFANRATLYVQARDLESAIKDYQQAIERDTQFATAHVGLGRVYHMLGQWEQALEQFNLAVKIEPNSPDIVCSRGDLHADRGNYGEALADYAQTIEIDSEFAHAYRNGAWLLATCPDENFRDPNNAVLGAQQALQYSYGERHVALDTLAAAYASSGQFEEAIAAVTEAVDLAPEAAKFTYLSRLQLYQQGQPFRTEASEEVSQAAYEISDK